MLTIFKKLYEMRPETFDPFLASILFLYALKACIEKNSKQTVRCTKRYKEARSK